MWDRFWDLDWANAQALYGMLLLPVVGALLRWLRAPDALEGKYRDLRDMATAGIATDEIHPRLARLFTSIPSPAGLVKRRWHEGDESELEDRLQDAHASRMVNEVAPFFAATAACKRHQEEIESWLKGQALGLLAYSPGALFICWAVLQQHYEMPPAAYWVAVCNCLVGATVATVFFGLELTTRNRLAALSKNHGRG